MPKLPAAESGRPEVLPRLRLSADGPVTPDTPERDPRAYTPKHLAERILQSKSALEGERKQVTVLFADIKSSSGWRGSSRIWRDRGFRLRRGAALLRLPETPQ